MTHELWDPNEIQPDPLNLYDWQAEAIEALRANIRSGVKNQILAAPTGSGKTVCASYLVSACREKGQRAVFVCDRIPLIDQTSRTFDRYGIPHGVIQADHWRDRPWERIQVASAQTLQRRGWPKDLALIVVDEAHGLYKAVVQQIGRRECVTVGLTATPFTKGLGRHYDAVVNVRTLNQLIEDRYLAPFTIFAPSQPDMSGARTVAGEWTDAEAETRSMPIVGDIVTEYLRHGGGKKFICFGVNVRHCEEIQRQMMSAGIICGLYTYRTADEARKQMIDDLADPRGPLQGLVSVSALAKGFDNPAIEVVILARPLRKSFAEHIQMIGRGLRSDPLNPHKKCVILDHAGNTVRFWDRMEAFFAEGVHELDDGKPKEKKPATEREREPVQCPKCTHVHAPNPMCPHCGHEYPRRSDIAHVPGHLSELTGLPSGSREDRQLFYSGLLWYARREKRYEKADGWVANRFRERFGVWPAATLAKEEAPPTQSLRDWIRSRHIAFAKGKAA